MKKASGEIGSVALLARVDPARVMAAANEELAHELSILQQRFTPAAESLQRAFGMRKTLRNLRLGNTAGFEQESTSDRVLDDLACLSSDLRSRLHSLTVDAQITGDGEETESENEGEYGEIKCESEPTHCVRVGAIVDTDVVATPDNQAAPNVDVAVGDKCTECINIAQGELVRSAPVQSESVKRRDQPLSVHGIAVMDTNDYTASAIVVDPPSQAASAEPEVAQRAARSRPHQASDDVKALHVTSEPGKDETSTVLFLGELRPSRPLLPLNEGSHDTTSASDPPPRTQSATDELDQLIRDVCRVVELVERDGKFWLPSEVIRGRMELVKPYKAVRLLIAELQNVQPKTLTLVRQVVRVTSSVRHTMHAWLLLSPEGKLRPQLTEAIVRGLMPAHFAHEVRTRRGFSWMWFAIKFLARGHEQSCFNNGFPPLVAWLKDELCKAARAVDGFDSPLSLPSLFLVLAIVVRVTKRFGSEARVQYLKSVLWDIRTRYPRKDRLLTRYIHSLRDWEPSSLLPFAISHFDFDGVTKRIQSELRWLYAERQRARTARKRARAE